jgi:hypothetical protein
MRAVEANGYPNLQALVWAGWKNASGVGWAKASFSYPKRYKAIADTLGIKLRVNSSPSFSRSGLTSESPRAYDSMSIPEKIFRDDGRYFCPECLKENAYWRKSWTLKTYAVCSKHQQFLLKDCQSCGSSLYSWRGKLGQCKCGADLTAMKSESADSNAWEWWIKCHNRKKKQSQIVDAVFLALELIDGGDDSPKMSHKRLSAVFEWMARKNVHPYLLEIVEQNSGKTHPRIQLLPLLKSSYAELKGLAGALLSVWMPRIPTKTDPTGRWMQIQEAELSLGISRFQFKKFIALGLVGMNDGHPITPRRISFDVINRMLYSLQSISAPPRSSEGRRPTCSVAKMVLDIFAGSRIGAGYDVDKGMISLRLLVQDQAEGESVVEENWLDMRQISSLLGTYPEAVRFLVNKGRLPGKHQILLGRKKFVASRSTVEDFSRSYIYAGVYARQIKMNPTNLAEKLMALGIEPVSGPKVDGALVYLFRRDDVAQFDVETLRTLKGYETKTGRKSEVRANAERELRKKLRLPEVLTAVQAAEKLEIKPYQIRTLIEKGLLDEIERKKRMVCVTLQSVEKLYVNLNRKDMVPVEDAAAQFNLSKKAFETLWIKRGILKVEDLGLWRRIEVKDLQELSCQLEGRVTASEAGQLISMHRSHLPNMERRGEIKSQLVGDKRVVRLYERFDLEKLIYLGNKK